MKKGVGSGVGSGSGSEVRIRGSGSAPKCHGSPTRLKYKIFRDRLGGLTYDEVECCVSRRVLHHKLQAGYLSAHSFNLGAYLR
jgi:hypothetical protein